VENNQIPLPMFGVWLPGIGWLRGANNQAYADYNIDVARQVAGRIGSHAKVYYVDAAIVDMEQKLLEAEKNRKLVTWRRLFMGVKT